MKNKYRNRGIARLITAIIFLGCTVSVYAQDIPLNHLYNRYKYAVNPAALRINEGIGVNLNYANNQLSEINAIQKFGLGVDGGFLYDNMAVGLYLSREEQNILDRTNVQLSYAYRLKLAKDHYLTLGLSAGIAVQGINTNKIYTGSGFDMSDIALGDNQTNAIFGFGVNYRYNQLELDLAIPSYSLINKDNLPLFASAAYTFELDNEIIDLRPQVMFNGLFPSQNFVDIRFQGLLHKKYWAEIGYRSTNELLIGIGTELSNFQFDYMFGLNVGKFGETNNGIHELVVAYRFKNTKLEKSASRAERNEKALADLSSEIDGLKADNKATNQSIEELNKSVRKLNNDINSELKNQLTEIKETVQSMKEEEIEQVDESKIRSTGYFVVVFSTTTMQDAEKIVTRMKKQGEEGQILAHTNRKHYFVYTQVKDSLDEAMDAMNEERNRGYSGAWVLVVK